MIMIINLNCLQECYPEIPIESLDNLLIDTWFIDDQPNIYNSTFPYLKIPSFSDINVVKVIKKLQSSSSFVYNTFEINELTLSYLYSPKNIVDHINKFVDPERWKHSYTFEHLIENQDKSWDDLELIFSNHKEKEWGTLFLMIDCDLHVFNNQRNLQNRVFSQAIQVFVRHKKDQTNLIRSKSVLDYSFSLNIDLKFWSLLKEDNREDIMMIYLCHLGLLKGGKTRNQELIATLLEIRELNEIAEQARKFGLIEVTEEEYDFYECSILVLPDRDKLYLRDNRELAEINRPIFLDFLEKFEQDFKPKSRQLFSVWL
jgi:hypothetical protein